MSPAYTTLRRPPCRLEGRRARRGNAELLVPFHEPATSRYPFMYHCHIAEHEEAGMMGNMSALEI
jgi:FtsP/CotA-like multicopper oxidase with cupredoxin domain